MTADTREYEDALRRLAIDDAEFVALILARYSATSTAEGLEPGHGAIDDYTRRLVALAALIAVGSGPTSIDAAVSAAFGAGASSDQIVEVLLSITPAVGAGRVVSCAPAVAAAIGYDLDADLEQLHPVAATSD